MFKKIKIYKNEILEENGKIRYFVVIFPNLVIEDDVENFSGSVIGRLPKGAIIEDDVSIGAGSIVNKNVFPSNFMVVFPQNILLMQNENIFNYWYYIRNRLHRIQRLN